MQRPAGAPSLQTAHTESALCTHDLATPRPCDPVTVGELDWGWERGQSTLKEGWSGPGRRTVAQELVVGAAVRNGAVSGWTKAKFTRSVAASSPVSQAAHGWPSDELESQTCTPHVTFACHLV